MKRVKEKKTKDNTIFIQIASYRDPQLSHTLKDMLDKAKYPEKETEEYKNATDRVWRGYNVNLSVTIDENGIPTFEVLNDGN
jgi:hypothetical protein